VAVSRVPGIMFDPIARPSSSQRLAEQMQRLNTGAAPECSIGDLSVSDVFSPEADIDMETEPSQQPPRSPIDPSGPKITGPQFAPNAALAAATPPLHEKAAHRKKKKRQQRRLADVEVGRHTPTVRGFTPMASGDEDSDFSAAGSQTMSPQLNPIPTSNNPVGISALKLQLDALSLAESQTLGGASIKGCEMSSNASVSSDSDRTEVLTSYEVPLEHDFISDERFLGVIVSASRSSSVTDKIM